MSNDDNFVTQSECAASRKEMFGLVTNIHDDVKKHGRALYGNDGRGGMQHDMTVTKETVGRIEEIINNNKDTVVRNEEISVKRLMAYITIVCAVVTAIVGPLVISLVQHVFK